MQDLQYLSKSSWDFWEFLSKHPVSHNTMETLCPCFSILCLLPSNPLERALVLFELEHKDAIFCAQGAFSCCPQSHCLLLVVGGRISMK